ncbi:MAG: hypothetical protein KAT79_01050 [candidate division Zixibacteria bacterium]|nr:hypothetical protein [candidate division Zixibacteria bacterium]
MIEQKWIEIINRSFDGDLSPDEEQSLNEFLTGNPEANEYRQELEQMARTLGKAPEFDPPSDMKSRIIREIGHTAKVPARKSSRGVIESIKDLVAPRIVYPFAVGLAAGVAVFALWVNQPGGGMPTDGSGMSGAIGLADSAPIATVVARHEIDLPGVQGFAETQRHGSTIRLIIEGTAENTSVLELAFDHADLATRGYTQTRSGEPFVASAGRISAILNGSDRFEFFFEDITARDSEIVIQVQTGESHHQIRINTGEVTE